MQPTQPAPSARQTAFSRLAPNAQAILLILGAFFCFNAMDATAKGVSLRVGPVPALWARYAGQALLVLIIVAPRLRSVARTNFPGMQLLRSIFLMCATVSFFVGITHIGLAEATAIMDLNPVFITLGAALFLGEKIGPRRVAGIGVAMVGALIVIRPGGDVFSPWALMPLSAAFFYSAYMIATRYVGRAEDPWTSLLYTALFGAVIISCALPWFWQPLDGTTLALMGLITVLGTTGQLLLIRALVAGEASMLAPFSYIGLIFATFWGAVAFDEWPDRWTILGALVIVGSGLYVWHREHRAPPRA